MYNFYVSWHNLELRSPQMDRLFSNGSRTISSKIFWYQPKSTTLKLSVRYIIVWKYALTGRAQRTVRACFFSLHWVHSCAIFVYTWSIAFGSFSCDLKRVFFWGDEIKKGHGIYGGIGKKSRVFLNTLWSGFSYSKTMLLECRPKTKTLTMRHTKLSPSLKWRLTRGSRCPLAGPPFLLVSLAVVVLLFLWYAH